MKKISVTAVVLSFFLITTPVYATGTGFFGFNFGDFFQSLRLLFTSTTTIPSYNNQLLEPTGIQVGGGFGQFGPTDTLKGVPVITQPPEPTGLQVGGGLGQFGPTIKVNSPRPTAPSTTTNGESGNQFIPDGRYVHPIDRPTQDLNRPTITPDETPGTDRATRLQATVTRILDNYQNRLDNYSDFLTKVKSRRDKLAASGKDVSLLNGYIQTAATNLATAQTSLNTAKNALSALDYSANPGSIIRTVEAQLKPVRQAMTTLHTSMAQTIKQIVILSASPTRGDQSGTGAGGEGAGGGVPSFVPGEPPIRSTTDNNENLTPGTEIHVGGGNFQYNNVKK